MIAHVCIHVNSSMYEWIWHGTCMVWPDGVGVSKAGVTYARFRYALRYENVETGVRACLAWVCDQGPGGEAEASGP